MFALIVTAIVALNVGFAAGAAWRGIFHDAEGADR